MCDPVTLTVLAVASAGAGVAGNRSAASAQFDGLETQRRTQGDEISDQASQALGERVKQGRAERARLRVAAGEAGVSGNSFEAQLADSFFQEDEDAATISKNADNSQRASEARFQSGVASVKNPGLLENGLSIASAGIGGFQTGLQIQDVKSRTTA